VPLSPIKHSDWPLLTQPQPARVLMVAGLMAVFAAGGAAFLPVVALSQQQLG
jgi:hypothetical protein